MNFNEYVNIFKIKKGFKPLIQCSNKITNIIIQNFTLLKNEIKLKI